MRLKTALLIITTSLLVQRCAKQTAPTGGPKDERAPKLIRSNPVHKETNVKAKELELTFDELIQLANPREQIIITPTIGKKFEAIAKKNKVMLKFNAELQANTTYSINFRETVQDLTEKNPAKVKLAFSTGTYVDSLTIVGKVKEILLDKDAGNYTVALTQASDTFNIFKHSAAWITLTDKQGSFALENLKPGKYFLYAFEDKNKNLIVDAKSERYGFKSDYINLEKSIDTLTVEAFKLDPAKLKLLSARPTFAYYTIRFSKSLTDYTLTATDSTKKIYATLESDLTTIKVYNTIKDMDSLQVRVQAYDSIANKVDSLVYVKFQKKESTKDKFNFKVDYSNVYDSKATLTAQLTFTKPVTAFLTDSVYIQVDSITRLPFTKTDFQWNDKLTILNVSKKIATEQKTPATPETASVRKNYGTLIFGKGSIISIEGDTLVRATSALKTIVPEDNAIIITKIETKENFMLQVLDKSGKIISETSNMKTYSFENIPAGTYFLRLLIDLNKNGKWDAGNAARKQQPEPVLFYTNPKGGKEIFVKANWQVGPLLISH
jgi:uncharacterized protein (DUF2141 family)